MDLKSYEVLPFQEVENNTHYDEKDCDYLMDGDINVTDFNTKKLIFSLRKDVISKSTQSCLIKNLLPYAKKTRSYNRKNVSDDKHINSSIAGYFNPQFKGKDPYVETSFTKKYPNNWRYVVNIVKEISDLYREQHPQCWDDTHNRIKEPKFIINDSVFSTLTMNYNLRCKSQSDKGNAKGSYSAITTTGEYNGCKVIFPRYKMLVNLQPGDLLIFDPFEKHCNSESSNNVIGDRMSIVFYVRSCFLN